MFAMVSTLAKIEKGLKPKNRATFVAAFHDEIVSTKGVIEALAQDKAIPSFLVPAIVSALDTLDDTFRVIPEAGLAPTVDAYHQLVSVMLHTYRLWNAIYGENHANTAMYSLLLKHKALTLLGATITPSAQQRKDA